MDECVAHLLSGIETFLMMRLQLDDLGDRSESENVRRRCCLVKSRFKLA